MKIYVLIFFLFSGICLSQTINIPAEHDVYDFLKRMYVAGFLTNYNNQILPKSKKEVIKFLAELRANFRLLNNSDQQKLQFYEEKICKSEHSNLLFESFPDSLLGNFLKYKNKHLYNYTDTSLAFFIDPMLDYKLIYNKENQTTSSLLNIGGKAYGYFYNWLGFYISGSNGMQFGNREAAFLDKRIKQSFTFNNTKINYFDATSGYIKLEKDLFNIELGRERLLIGNSDINRIVLSENPPLFDFVKFDLGYKGLSYKFIHSWLVQKPTITYIDSIKSDVKEKKSKYFAFSRLGIEFNNLGAGISQAIIYSNRSFEAAYLNPFLFWESAQRSLNDLDNSFLLFDLRYRIFNGLEFYGTYLMDDLSFEDLKKEGLASVSNRSAWQIGLFITEPILFERVVLKVDYIQVRPYTFSHPGIGEALTYTNNGYMLGVNVFPNSTVFSVEINYDMLPRMNVSFRLDNYLHGNNIVDSSGNILKNVGGDINYFFTLDDLRIAPLLDGIRETTVVFNFNINYELLYGFYFNLDYNYLRNKIENTLEQLQHLSVGVKIDFE